MKKVTGWSVFAFCLFLLAACSREKDSVFVKGTLTDCTKKWVYFSEIRPDGAELLDSAEIQDGTFAFALTASDELTRTRRQEPFFLQIALDKRQDGFVTLVKNGESISVTGNAQRLAAQHGVTGGGESANMMELDTRLTHFIDSVEVLYEIYETDIENDTVRERVEDAYLKLVEHHTSFLTDFIRHHPRSLSSIAAFYSRYNRRIFLPEKENVKMLQSLIASLEKTYPGHEYVLYLKKRVKTYQQ